MYNYVNKMNNLLYYDRSFFHSIFADIYDRRITYGISVKVSGRPD